MAFKLIYVVKGTADDIGAAKQILADHSGGDVAIITDAPAEFDAPTTPVIALNQHNRVALNHYFRTVKAQFSDCKEFYTTHAAGYFGEAAGIADLKIQLLSDVGVSAPSDKPKNKKKTEVEDAGHSSSEYK